MTGILKKINNIFILYFLSLISVVSFHFIIRDALFFHTKIQYILYYLFFTSFLILIIFFFYFVFFVKKDVFFEACLKFVILISIINFFRSIFFFFDNKINSALIEVIIFVTCILFSTYIASKIHLNKVLVNKAYFIFKIFSYSIFFILLVNFSYQKYIVNDFKVKESKNPVVLIVIDGLPKNFIKNHTNKKKNINIINDEIRNKYIVQNYHKYITPNTWTCGFFSNLYGLSPKNSFRRDTKIKKLLSKRTFPEKNFFHELDNLNVTYTWAVSHSCAVPEGSSATISDYNGFKSILNFSRLMITYLDKINLPFHSIINIKGFRGDPTAVHLKSHSFIKKFFDIFAHSSDYNFQSHIFNTLKSSKKDFYIIHLNYTQWKYSEIKDFKKPIETLLNDINKFFKNISNDKYFNNFNFIITADHGFSFDIDDFGYASSHRSEVIEVPFIIIKKKAYENLKLSNSPNIHRPCSFMDFQKSLINYFKDKKELFSVNCSNEAKTSFSYPDDKNKQWILTVFENQNIYRYDLYNKFFDDTNDYLLNDKNKKNLLKFLEMYSIKIDNF